MVSVPVGHGSEKLKTEALDEVVLRAQRCLATAQPPITLPFCAFNGGRDAWVDVGDKRIGVEALQSYLKISPKQCLHVGDQFLKTGNDVAARAVSPCVWIISPKETLKVLEILLGLMGLAHGENLPQVLQMSPRLSSRPMPELAVPTGRESPTRSRSASASARHAEPPTFVLGQPARASSLPQPPASNAAGLGP